MIFNYPKFLIFLIGNYLVTQSTVCQVTHFDYESTTPLCYDYDLYSAKKETYSDSVFYINCVQMDTNEFQITELLKYPNLTFLTMDRTLGGNIETICEIPKLKFFQFQEYCFSFPKCLLKSKTLEHLAFDIDSTKKMPAIWKIESLESVILTSVSASNLDELLSYNWDERFKHLSINMVKGDSISCRQLQEVLKIKSLITLDLTSRNQVRIPRNIDTLIKLKDLVITTDILNAENIQNLSRIRGLYNLTIWCDESMLKLDKIDLTPLNNISSLALFFRDRNLIDKNRLLELQKIVQIQLPNTVVVVY